MKVRPALLVLLFCCIPFLASAEDSWVLKREKHGIQLFVRKVPGSGMKEFKGVMYLKDVSLSSLLATMDHAENYVRWLHNCGQARILKTVDLYHRYTYMVITAPWPVSDRDSIVYSVVSQDPKDLTITIQMNAVPDYMPPVMGKVRIPRLTGLWMYKPMENGSVMVIYQLHSEPGGSLPASLANTAVVDLPYYSLMNLMKILQKPMYRNAHYSEVKEPEAKK